MISAVTGRATALRRSGRLSGWTIAALGVAFLVSVPLVVVFGFALAPAGDVWRHLADTVLLDYIVNSLKLMVGVGAGTLVIGVGAAWFVTMCRFPGRRIFEWALVVPLAMPAYVIAYTYTGMFEFAGPVQGALREMFAWSAQDYWFPEIRSLPGAVAMMTLVLYPYVYLLARAAFLEQSVCVLEASRTLGHGPWRSFRAVALPLARPAIAAGVALALMETLNDFGTVQYFGIATFTTGIFRTWFGLGDPSAAAQLAAMLMIFIIALIVVERRARGGRQTQHSTNRYRPLPRLHLQGWRGWTVSVGCFLIIFLGFLLPAGALVGWAIRTAGHMVDGEFLANAFNSILLAGLAAGVCVGLGLVMAYGLRLQGGRLMRLTVGFASSGYALPGAVIAVGILIPFAWIDNTVDAALRARFGVSSGLILSGTIAAVTFAYIVRFMALAFGAVEASLGKVTASMDAAARTLGHGAGGVLWRVHMPVVRTSLLTAMLLVFVDVMKELPATLIMRPFNFDTLAVRTYQLATDERLADASTPALAIVLAGIGPVILLSLAIARARPGFDKGPALTSDDQRPSTPKDEL